MKKFKMCSSCGKETKGNFDSKAKLICWKCNLEMLYSKDLNKRKQLWQTYQTIKHAWKKTKQVKLSI